MADEWYEGCCYDEGEACIGEVIEIEEGSTKEKVAGEGETGGETVDSVDHINGIDDADTCEDGEWDGYVPRELMDAPESVEVVDTGIGAIDEGEDNGYLANDACGWGEADGIVKDAEIEHNACADNNWYQGEEGGEAACHCETAEDSDIYGESAHDGDGFFLELASIGIIGEVLGLCESEDFEIDLCDCEECDEGGQDDNGCCVH